MAYHCTNAKLECYQGIVLAIILIGCPQIYFIIIGQYFYLFMLHCFITC